jgi:hypothetical protein
MVVADASPPAVAPPATPDAAGAPDAGAPVPRVSDKAARRAAAAWLRAADAAAGVDTEDMVHVMMFPARIRSGIGKPGCEYEEIVVEHHRDLGTTLGCIADGDLLALAAAAKTARVYTFVPGADQASSPLALGPTWAASPGAVVVFIQKGGVAATNLEVVPADRGAVVRNVSFAWAPPGDH